MHWRGSVCRFVRSAERRSRSPSRPIPSAGRLRLDGGYINGYVGSLGTTQGTRGTPQGTRGATPGTRVTTQVTRGTVQGQIRTPSEIGRGPQERIAGFPGKPQIERDQIEATHKGPGKRYPKGAGLREQRERRPAPRTTATPGLPDPLR